MTTRGAHKTLMVACGALAKEVVALRERLGLDQGVFDLRCLPASYHNFPDKIVPALEAILDDVGAEYDRVILGYGDCGTGGGLDRMMETYPNTERLPGAHCYAFYAGLPEFDALMDEELGSFFLTDYLARHFETLVIKGFGLDRYPNLIESYFAHYTRLVYMSQSPTPELIARAQSAAGHLGLAFEHRDVGYGHLGKTVASTAQEAHHV